MLANPHVAVETIAGVQSREPGVGHPVPIDAPTFPRCRLIAVPVTIATGDANILGKRSAALQQLCVLAAVDAVRAEPSFEAHPEDEVFAKANALTP